MIVTVPDVFYGDETLLISYKISSFSSAMSVKVMIFNVIKFLLKLALSCMIYMSRDYIIYINQQHAWMFALHIVGSSSIALVGAASITGCAARARR